MLVGVGMDVCTYRSTSLKFGMRLSVNMDKYLYGQVLVSGRMDLMGLDGM